MVRQKREHAVIAGECFIAALEVSECKATVVECFGIVGQKRECPIIAGKRLIETLQIPECKTKVGEERGMVRLDVNRALDQRDGCRRVFALKFHHAQEMERVGIVGILGEYLSIESGRFTKPAFLVKREGFSKHRTGPRFYPSQAQPYSRGKKCVNDSSSRYPGPVREVARSHDGLATGGGAFHRNAARHRAGFLNSE